MRVAFNKTSETDLLNGCLQGDRLAQKCLYEKYAPKMYIVCCRYLKDPMEAEDALVTAFMRIFEKLGQFKGEGSLEGWMKTIIIREALTTLRKNKNQFYGSEGEIQDLHIEDPHHYDQLENEDLLKIIQDMPAGYRAVFNMYAMDGYTHKEIADQLGISENTSKSQLSRARKFLQDVLAKHHIIQKKMTNDITTG